MSEQQGNSLCALNRVEVGYLCSAPASHPSTLLTPELTEESTSLTSHGCTEISPSPLHWSHLRRKGSKKCHPKSKSICVLGEAPHMERCMGAQSGYSHCPLCQMIKQFQMFQTPVLLGYCSLLKSLAVKRQVHHLSKKGLPYKDLWP